MSKQKTKQLTLAEARDLVAKLEAEHRSYIEKENAKFESMTLARKRVAIAKDVLKQLHDETLRPQFGTWFALKEVPDEYKLTDSTVVADMELQKVFTESDIRCSACALGGLFMSTVRVANKVKVGEVFSGGRLYEGRQVDFRPIAKKLTEFFTPEQVCMMENAFEGRTTNFFLSEEARVSDEMLEVAARFGRRSRSPATRMRMVMENIIRNRGEFKPWLDLKVKKPAAVAAQESY